MPAARPLSPVVLTEIGPYRVLRCIAQGGMGEVYLATLEREAGFRKVVAVKRALPALSSDPRVAQRFEREARLAAVLTHRHIVQIFDFGRLPNGDGAWLAMEYVQGVDLKAVQDRLGTQPLPLGLALEIGLGCARGLQHAHRATDAAGTPLNLVHRDVSPQNVLLSFDGDVKLTDFGLADAATTGADGLIQGKFAYMSPEQARGGAVDARSDQFSLGVVLYECFSGHRAFHGGTSPMAMLDVVSQGRPVRPLADFGVAAPLVEVVERAMAPSPAERYPDLAVLTEALRQAGVAAGASIGDPPLGDWLRGLFPERVGPAAPTATQVTQEPTAVAECPAGGAVNAMEATVDAVAPATLGTPAPPRGQTFRGDSPMPAPAPAAPRRPRTLLWPAAVLLVAGGLALATRGPTAPAPIPEPSPAPVVAPAPTTVAVVLPRPVDRPPGWRPAPESAPPVPNVVSTAPVASEPPRPAPTRPVHGSVVAPSAAAASAPAQAPQTAPPVVASPPPAPPSAATVAPTPIRPDAGPRFRMSAMGATVRSEGGALDGWRGMTGDSLLASVVGGAGPPVKVRLLRAGHGLRANVAASPNGELTMDGAPLGDTPRADLPLRPGTRRFVVRAPDGSETRFDIDVALDGEGGP